MCAAQVGQEQRSHCEDVVGLVLQVLQQGVGMSAGIRRCHYKEQCSAFLKSLGIDEKAYLQTPCNTKPSTSSPAGAEKPRGDFSSELKSNGQLTRPRLSR